ncbi:MAG TPA: glycan-binding surface protein [Bacteroidia bacterium]|jgi:hypothetical protein|nr:glycan-binding surface protein [Bacteroidia bacterium]
MISNKRAFVVLLLLLSLSAAIFCVEKKFLISEPRGAMISNYDEVAGIKEIILLVEDFEGFVKGTKMPPKENFFDFGNIKTSIDYSSVDNSAISLKSALRAEWKGTDTFGGWGKGIGANIDLDTLTDYLNFRVLFPKENIKEDNIKVMLEEDDNDDGVLQKDKDDAWSCSVNISTGNEWQMVSIPLKNFKDDNEGGDHRFNVTRKGGLHTIIFSFLNSDKYVAGQKWFFDFICFSKGKIKEMSNN